MIFPFITPVDRITSYTPLRHPMRAPYISAVITCLNEEHTIREFIESLDAALLKTRQEYEIIIVNDGSTDRTFPVIRELMGSLPRIRVAIDLMKNSGQVAAITAALLETRGDYVLMMDSDLQLIPDDVGLLIKEVQAGADWVNGYRAKRQDSFTRIIPSMLANVVMRRLSQSKIRDFGCSFRLVDQRLIRAFKLGPEKILSIPMMISKAGRVVEVPVRHRARPHGKSGWTFRKLWRYNADNVVALAEPIFQYIGFWLLFVAFVLFLRVALDPWLHWSILGSISNGLILNTVVGAFLATAGILCVVGEFIVRCHRSVLAKPGYVIRDRVSQPGSDSPA